VTESNQLPNKVAATKSGGNNVMGLEFNSNKVFFDYSGLIPFFIFALIFILVPTISVVFFAFKGNFGEWTLENLRVALREEYLSSLIGSLRLGFFSAITGAFFGFLLHTQFQFQEEKNFKELFRQQVEFLQIPVAFL